MTDGLTLQLAACWWGDEQGRGDDGSLEDGLGEVARSSAAGRSTLGPVASAGREKDSERKKIYEELREQEVDVIGTEAHRHR
jgi:hypothetical protein